MEHSTERLEKLEQQKQKLYREARKLADALTQTRVAAFDQLNKQITKELDFLNMPGVRFALSIRKGPLASAGQDAVEFLISANPGEEPKPLAKIASGGELSRIMLAIQTALAEKDDIPTIIYDEIDTGVSGLAASRIGRKLHQSSKGRQVLCITHTAQIAAMGISNQRETVAAWDRADGTPVGQALVWQCARAKEICDTLASHAEAVREKTGLPLSPYFSASKMAWILQNHPEAAALAAKERLALGTIDSYLVSRLSEERSFKTDYSNASRTQLFNIRTLQWDDELCTLYGVPRHCLAEV